MSRVPGRNRPSLDKPVGELWDTGEGSEMVAPIASCELDPKRAPQEVQKRAVSEASILQDLHLTINVPAILSIFRPGIGNHRLPDDNRVRSWLTTTNQVMYDCPG